MPNNSRIKSAAKRASDLTGTALFCVLVGPPLLATLGVSWGVSQGIRGIEYIRPKNVSQRKRERQCEKFVASPRPRALTIPLAEDADNQKTYSQAQSHFFKLPPELRRKIYLKLIKSSTPVHIWRTETTLCGMSCTLREPCSSAHKVSHWQCEPWMDIDRMIPSPMLDGDPSIIRFGGFLRTCRRMYSEAVDLMYEVNELYFDEAKNVHRFSRRVVPQRLASLRALRLDLDVFNDNDIIPEVMSTWQDACTALAKMTGLRKLHITLGAFVSRIDDPRPSAMPLLDPLKNVKATDYMVEIPSHAMTGGLVEDEGLPFVLIRREWLNGSWEDRGQLYVPRRSKKKFRLLTRP